MPLPFLWSLEFIAIGIALLGGAFFYWKSIRSRKVYRCPECHESADVELMEALHCNVCGCEFASKMKIATKDHLE